MLFTYQPSVYFPKGMLLFVVYNICSLPPFAYCVIRGQFVTLDSFQVVNNENSNDKLLLSYGDGSTVKSIAVHHADVILYKFEHVIVT
jgi:hypothetical protein